jgi:hypothetical protein
MNRIAGGPAERLSVDLFPPETPDAGAVRHEEAGDHLVERLGKEEALAPELRTLIEVLPAIAVGPRPGKADVEGSGQQQRVEVGGPIVDPGYPKIEAPLGFFLD